MKKIMLLMVAMVMGISAMWAQQGKMAGGINFGYGTEIETVGLGLKFQYGITDAVRAEVAFNHSFKKDYTKMWDLEATAHYLLPLGEKTTFYPLAGLCFVKAKASANISGYEISASNSEWGANLGAGIEHAITDVLSVGFEAKYQLVSDMDQAMFNIGVTYKF